MKSCNSFRQFPVLLGALLMSAVNAGACPDCTLINSGGVIEPQTVMAKMAFSFSTFFFLGIFFSVAGFLIWTMVRTCRELSLERPLSSPSEI